MSETVALFNQDHLTSLFEGTRRNVSEAIRRETKQQILNVNEAQYIEHILSKCQLLVPEIIESGIQVESSEVEIPAEQHSERWSVTPGRTYPRQKLTYEVPFTAATGICSDSPLRTEHSRLLVRGLDRVDCFLNLSFLIPLPIELKRSFRGV